LRTAPFWALTQLVVSILIDVSEQPVRPIFKFQTRGYWSPFRFPVYKFIDHWVWDR